MMLRLLLVVTIALEAAGERMPKITEHPRDATVSRLSVATLACKADAAPPPAITWFRDGQLLVSAAGVRAQLPGGALVIFRVRKAEAGVYWCRASNRVGHAVSKNATLRVAVLQEKFRTEPEDTRVSAGESALLACSPPRGWPTPSVQWKKNDRILDLDANPRYHLVDGGNLLIQDVRSADEGRFQCVAQNLGGTRETPVALLKVQVKPFVKRGPSKVTVSVGDSLVLLCQAGGEPRPRVSWRRTGARLPEGRSSVSDDGSLRIERVRVEDEGRYTCHASSALGTAQASANVSVHSPPQVWTAPEEQEVSEGGSAQFTCRASGSPAPTLFWSLDGKPGIWFAGDRDDNVSTNLTADGSLLLTLQAISLNDSGSAAACSAVSASGAAQARGRLRVTSAEGLPPPVISVGPSNQTLPGGALAVFLCKALGNPPPVITWYKQQRPLVVSRRVNITAAGTLLVTGVESADAGQYTCVASSRSGVAAWSAVLEVKGGWASRAPHPTTFPGAPSRPVPRLKPNNTVTVTWKQNNKIGSSSLLGFQVEMAVRDVANASRGWLVVARRTQTPAYTHRGLIPGGRYFFVVRAENSHGLSPPSDVSEAVVWPLEDPLQDIRKALASGLVQLTTLEAVSSTAVKLSWMVSAAAASSGAVEGLYVHWRALEGGGRASSALTVLHAGSGAAFHVSSLHKHSRYEFFLVPFFRGVAGRPSASRVVRTLEDVPTEPPIGVELTVVNGNGVQASWKPPPVDSLNGKLLYYKVWFERKSGANWTTVADISTTRSDETFDNLTFGCTYTVRVAAATGVGVGPFSPAVTIHLPDLHRKSGPASSLFAEAWFVAVLAAMVTVASGVLLGVLLVWQRQPKDKPKHRRTNSCRSNAGVFLSSKGLLAHEPPVWIDRTWRQSEESVVMESKVLEPVKRLNNCSVNKSLNTNPMGHMYSSLATLGRYPYISRNFDSGFKSYVGIHNFPGYHSTTNSLKLGRVPPSETWCARKSTLQTRSISPCLKKVVNPLPAATPEGSRQPSPQCPDIEPMPLLSRSLRFIHLYADSPRGTLNK